MITIILFIACFFGVSFLSLILDLDDLMGFTSRDCLRWLLTSTTLSIFITFYYMAIFEIFNKLGWL